MNVRIEHDVKGTKSYNIRTECIAMSTATLRCCKGRYRCRSDTDVQFPQKLADTFEHFANNTKWKYCGKCWKLIIEF